MSKGVRDVNASSRPGIITPGEPEHVQELVKRELANYLALHSKEAELRDRQRRYKELLGIRRRMRATIKSREEALRSDQNYLAEVERELNEIRLPPGLLISEE
jgi:hypothetical protein